MRTVLCLWFSSFAVFPLLSVLSSSVVKKNRNVCSNFKDYETIQFNKNCWYNPDVNAKPHAIAKRHGYRLEEHEVTTEDGYILTLHRIAQRNHNSSGPPVFMHHGIAMSSVFWMLKGKESPAFQLVDFGFDVWLGNARGNDFSSKHMNLSKSDPKFWDFSFHEMAIYDLPAAMDYVGEKTGRKSKITFIGHSMGTTISYIYSSIHPEHAKNNVNMLISIAPIAFLGHVKTWLSLGSPLHNVIERETNNIGLHGTGQYPQIRKMAKNFCFSFPYMNICQRVLQSVIGTSIEQIEPEVMPLFYRRYPGSFSIKTLLHYMQEVSAGGRFQWYDYGTKENMIRYNTQEPPEYDIEKIQVPVYLIYGEKDLLSTEDDVLKLYIKLRAPKYLKLFKGANNRILFNHNDFLYSKHMKKKNDDESLEPINYETVEKNFSSSEQKTENFNYLV